MLALMHQQVPNVNNIAVSANIMILLEPSPLLNEVDTSKTKTINIGTSLDVPTGCHSDAFKSLIDIPSNDTNCTGVDRKNGLWFHCNECNTEIKGRSGCPFTIG